MSRETVAVVQASFDAWNAGDMDAYRELLDADAMSRVPGNFPEPGPFAGRDAVMSQFLRLRDALDHDVAEPIRELIDAGDRVVSRFAWRGSGHGPEMNLELSCVYTVREGKILGFEFFWDHAEALEAAGMRQ
jgi:ketosteroid isomerase-like protein